MRRLLLPLTGGLFALTACVIGPGTGDTVPAGDPVAFRAEVQPILAGCANPSCHGDPDRPLEVYAAFSHRLDPSMLFLDEPITDEELDLNRLRFCALLTGHPDAEDSAALTKPLDPASGGSEHVGGVVFGDTDEPEYVTLLRWAQDAIDEVEPP